MPNWCANAVVLRGDPPAVDRAERAARDGRLFEEYLPQPHPGEWDARWCVENWGTKWDVTSGGVQIDRESPGELTLLFETAWTPPIPVFRAMRLGGLYVRAVYFEPGVMFGGVCDASGDRSYVGDQLEEPGFLEDHPDGRALEEAFEVSHFFEV